MSNTNNLVKKFIVVEVIKCVFFARYTESNF